MKKLVIVALLWIAPLLRAQCVPQIQVQPTSRIEITSCPSMPALSAGQNFTIDPGTGVPLAVTVAEVRSSALATVIITTPLESGTPAITAINQGQTVTLKIGEQDISANVQSAPSALNTTRYTWSVGPATQGNASGQAPPAPGPNDPPAAETSDPTGAIRLRYDGEYARGGFFGTSHNPLLQTIATVSIDTTDQDATGFIDNNTASLGAHFTSLSFGRLWMHGKAGADVRYQKAVHSDVRNADAVLTVSGWVPVLRSITLFSRNGDFIAAPLSFTASYGYRVHEGQSAASRGTVFDVTANYNMYLFDQYQLTLTGTLTHNDLDDTAKLPSTQRMYKASIAYLANPSTGFKVLTSIEDGSAGVMLTKVRQYFIGVALARLNLGGGSK
ncbi:MAG TPA: hypothetical protein VF911_09235 [Thermoanaerobaculia bacterium]|jgi:hypothetical protein